MSGECDTCKEHPLDCKCSNKINDIIYKPEWGYHNLMVIAAFRYCLGRRTYIVSSCVDWLVKYWDDIDPNTRSIIVEETKKAIDNGDSGDFFDTGSWQQLLRHAKKDM